MFLELLPVLVVLCQISCIYSQEGRRDDSHVENVVRQAVADEFSSEILTNRTRAYLSCASGEMMVKLNFSEPFRGITYTDYDRTSPCKFYGDGSTYYELRIPLQGCGTRQEAPRVFINNIVVRFHRSLELEEDEIKTIICRYPPPLAPPPANVAPVLVPTSVVPAIIPPKLSEVELLLIICALLFLTLLLLGIGIAYYCLKKRNIKVVKRRKAISSGPGSEITKLSGSTMGTLSMFDPIRIPRAMAQSTSGSEAALLTPLSSQNGSGDTIPSDYPSESPSSLNSDVEEMDGRRSMIISETSTVRNDHFRYENTAFIPDEGSVRSGYPEDLEREQSLASVQVPAVIKIPEAKKQTKIAIEKLLTTISEREDILQRELYEKKYARVTTAQPELYAPAPKYAIDAPVYARIRKRDLPSSYPPSLYGSIPDNDDRSHSEFLEPVAKRSLPSESSYAPSLRGSIPDNDIWSHTEVESQPPTTLYRKQPNLQTATLTDYLVSTQRTTDVQEDINKLTKDAEMKAIVPRKPKITVQNIDDIYVTTTTEVEATEFVTKHTKDTTEQHMRPIQPSWDVTIRHYPAEPPEKPSVLTTKYLEMTDTRRQNDITEDYTSEHKSIYSTTPKHYPPGTLPPPPPPPPPPPYQPTVRPIRSIITKILDPPPMEEVEKLTPEVKEKWRTVITSDITFCTLIEEATTYEEYVRISRDVRYENLFDPPTWEVIIRVLSIPDYLNPPATAEPGADVRVPRYRKKVDHEVRGRRGSLPPVHEANSRMDYGSIRSRRTSRSGSMPDFDLRSMTEVDVDFARADRDSLWSVDTGYTYRTSRSIAERSTSEFLEDVPTVTQQRTAHHYMEQASAQFTTMMDSYSSRDDVSEYSDVYDSGRNFSSHRPVLERSSSEYMESAAALSLPPDRYSPPSSRRIRSTRPALERSSTEIIINSPIIRAMDRASSIGEREEIKSVTETDIFDWKR